MDVLQSFDNFLIEIKPVLQVTSCAIVKSLTEDLEDKS